MTEGQKSYSMGGSVAMLERTFLGAPKANTVPLLSTFLQRLPSYLGLGEALSALVENLCKGYLEVQHASRHNLLTSSSRRIFLTRDSSIL